VRGPAPRLAMAAAYALPAACAMSAASAISAACPVAAMQVSHQVKPALPPGGLVRQMLQEVLRERGGRRRRTSILELGALHYSQHDATSRLGSMAVSLLRSFGRARFQGVLLNGPSAIAGYAKTEMNRGGGHISPEESAQGILSGTSSHPAITLKAFTATERGGLVRRGGGVQCSCLTSACWHSAGVPLSCCTAHMAAWPRAALGVCSRNMALHVLDAACSSPARLLKSAFHRVPPPSQWQCHSMCGRLLCCCSP
jgi:hypothetical protein